jgi:hypothetical protein
LVTPDKPIAVEVPNQNTIPKTAQEERKLINQQLKKRKLK